MVSQDIAENRRKYRQEIDATLDEARIMMQWLEHAKKSKTWEEKTHGVYKAKLDAECLSSRLKVLFELDVE